MGRRLLSALTTSPQEDNSSFYCVLLWSDFSSESPGITGKGHNPVKKKKNLPRPWETKCQLIYPVAIKGKRNRESCPRCKLTIPNLQFHIMKKENYRKKLRARFVFQDMCWQAWHDLNSFASKTWLEWFKVIYSFCFCYLSEYAHISL